MPEDIVGLKVFVRTSAILKQVSSRACRIMSSGLNDIVECKPDSSLPCLLTSDLGISRCTVGSRCTVSSIKGMVSASLLLKKKQSRR